MKVSELRGSYWVTLSLDEIAGPAIFCQVIAIKNCFYQLEQIGIYDEHTLQPYGKKLQQLESILTEDEQNCALPPPILELVRYNYSVCSKHPQLQIIHLYTNLFAKSVFMISYCR